MDPQTLKSLNRARKERRAAILLTQLGDGRDRLILETDPVAGELGEAVRKAFLSGKSGLHEIGNEQFFLNVHVPPPRIVVIGAVHISKALGSIAATTGYDLMIIDPRTAFATKERFGDTMLHADWPEQVLKDHGLDGFTALVAVTHDPKIDDFPIASAIRAGCFYIGALGSRKTHAKRLERLAAQGFSQAELEAIHAPIGLDIGASSPQEIAVAIMAEIIGALRKRDLARDAADGAGTGAA
jgi:xanthine dehydrogenase accessory factor